MAPPPPHAKPKAKAAFKAMRKLGVPVETISLNLKKLLKLYDKNWALIEEDNYRSLADFIFQSQEEEGTHQLKEANSEAPLSVSPSQEHFGGGGYVTSGEDEIEFGSPLAQGGLVEGKGKWLVSGRFGSREEGISGSKRPFDKCDDNAQFKVPKSVVFPSESAPTGNKDQQRRSITTPKTASITDSSASDLEIASSELGDVKVSMHLDFAVEQPDFCMPNIDEVFKMVEEKCIQTYQITNPNFSLKKLMKDFCKSCLEAGTETEKDGEGLVNGIPALDSLKNSCTRLTANNVFILSADGKVQSA
ncbi:hypothetical protein MKX01_031446 [Papaver californicum]|nr:hypothetical protein MKX01_031446 [Papaver californicum]